MVCHKTYKDETGKWVFPEDVEKNNNQLITLSLSVLIPFMIIGIALSYIIFIYSKEKFRFKRIVMEDFILILIIIGVEMAYFGGITYNYRYLDKNKIIAHTLTEIKNKIS